MLYIINLKNLLSLSNLRCDIDIKNVKSTFVNMIIFEILL